MAERARTPLHALLQAALERPPDERERWADEACGSDLALRDRLRSLLRALRDDPQDRSPTGPVTGGGGAMAGDAAALSPSSLADDAVPLAPGHRLGRYEILDFLGAGGMGTVYRALDPSLGREVAIKALAQAFRGDSGSLRRFEREARVLATLSHPNIAAIYGLERFGDAPYLVLEKIDGETLADRIARGPMPWREAAGVALQIVDGLDEAHRKGVIHRDLKPSNVMLAPGGRAKLVDFGLAKTLPARGEAEVSAALTTAGAVLGTARYMSPEQVQGAEVDARTDVWAFGCVLYEMLTGRESFAGRSVPEVLAAVLRDEPDWSALPADLPHAIHRLLRRCLRRDLRTRLQHIGDARLDLVDPALDATPMPAGAQVRALRSSPAAFWTAGALAALAVGALALYPARVLLRSRPPESAARPVRLSLDLPSHLRLGADYAAPFAIAPAGSPLAIEAAEGPVRRLYVRDIGDLAVRALPGTDGARQPFFSNDGAWVGFFADRKLMKVPIAGGPPLPLADIGSNPRGAAWLADGSIVVAPSQTSGLVRIPDRGGRPARLTTLDRSRGEYSHRWPDPLTGTKWVLFTVGIEDASFDEGRIEAVSLETGERRVILAGAGFARHLPPDRLLFVRGGRLSVVPFDPDRLVVRGAPEVAVDAVRYDPRNGGTHLAASASGVLVYGPGTPSSSEYHLSWIDRDGRITRALETPRMFRDPRLGPGGRQIALAVSAASGSDLWLVDGNATLSQLSFGLTPYRPTWSADGTRITVGAAREGRWRLLTIAADGTGTPAVLFESAHRVYPDAWSPDGRRLVFQENRPDTGWDLHVLEVDASGRTAGPPRAFAATPFHEANAVLSPDGRWIAYESDELDGVAQIYARSFPDGAHKVRISSGGARWPAWGPDGDLYFFDTSESRLRLARTRQDGTTLAVTASTPVWTDPRTAAAAARMVVGVAGARYDVHPAGARFLILESSSAAAAPPLSRPVVAFDWAGARRQ